MEPLLDGARTLKTFVSKTFFKTAAPKAIHRNIQLQSSVGVCSLIVKHFIIQRLHSTSMLWQTSESNLAVRSLTSLWWIDGKPPAGSISTMRLHARSRPTIS